MVLPNLSFDVLHDAKLSDGYFANLDEERVRESERRYKQFLNLARKYPEATLTPAMDIDEVWHMHMLRPAAYQKDCYSLFGEILDHDGGFGKASDQQLQELETAFAKTSDLWEKEYGEPYARLAVLLNDVRGWAKGTLPTYQDRKVFFEGIVNGEPDPIELLRAGDEAAVRDLIAAAQRTHTPAATA